MRMLNIYISVCLSIIAGAFTLIDIWLFYPYQPFTFYTESNKIVTPIVRAGEPVVWQTDVFQNTNGKLVEVSRAIEDGYLINLPDTSYTTRYGRMTFNNSSVVIPKFTPPGKYHIVIYNRVHVNPIRTVLIIRKTEEFEVVQ